jgi:hydrogenase expression/formation protein HypD
MKYVDEFRDPTAAQRLVEMIRQTATRRWTLMEVCGGQTHNLLRFGIDAAIEDCIELIHGPGCPVCVTPVEAIDAARELSLRPNMVLASFGDMLRVPGSCGTLQSVQAEGGRIAVVYSPLDAVELARQQPEDHFVFFAVGFETTAPATALAVQQAARHGLTNFSLLVAHVCVLPAMRVLADAQDHRVQAFLAAGHVCTVTGFADYDAFVRQFRLPVVVTGFEPIDLLEGILACVRQLEAGDARVENCYARSVRREGNPAAQRLMDEVYSVCDAPWRGFGIMPQGGLRLRDNWQQYDARRRFLTSTERITELTECRAGDVLAGRIKPTECPHFGNRCTPDTPLGAPMVSSEGACAAYHRYRGTVSV